MVKVNTGQNFRLVSQLKTFNILHFVIKWGVAKPSGSLLQSRFPEIENNFIFIC